MLRHFLMALHVSGADKVLKRVILVTGAKQYGVHLGIYATPFFELVVKYAEQPQVFQRIPCKNQIPGSRTQKDLPIFTTGNKMN